MATESNPPGPSDPAPAGQAPHGDQRIAFERLRERTDELELIVSGLTVFALFSLPELLLALWLRMNVHVGGDMLDILSNVFVFGSGLSYALALAFVAHIAVRAYWVGLIGLKSAFPRGVRWDSTPTMGPVSRDYFRRRLPDIDTAIHRADRLGSMIFALASLIGILVGWVAVMVVTVITAISVARLLFGISTEAANTATLVLVGVLMALSIVNWFTDTRVLRDESRLARYPRLGRWLARSVRSLNAILPQRLILPVQLTLQSNLPPKRFIVIFAVAVALVPFAGLATLQTRLLFAPVNSYQWFDDEIAEGAMRSAYYESMRGEDDAVVHVPTIPSDRVADAYLRLYLPHLPARDNDVLARHCDGETDAGDAKAMRDPAAADAHLARRAACFAAPWRITLDGQPVDGNAFHLVERRDLGTRGIQAYLPLAGFAPGQHVIDLRWNPDGPAEGAERARRYRIPFWFAPAYELGLDMPAVP